MKWSEWERIDGFNFREIYYQKKYRDIGGGIARIVFNRPKRMNTLTHEGFEDIAVALDNASHDPEIGGVVFYGEGDHFGAGGDIKWEETEDFTRMIKFRTIVPNRYIRLCKKPTIAAVKGYCVGASHHIAYFCDFTIAAEDAIFGQNGPKIGSPAHGYVVSYLTRVVGSKKAREIWMLCKRYTAQEALQMGLVNTVVPVEKLEEEVDKWCNDLLNISPSCLKIVKASFESDIDYLEADFGKILDMLAPDFLESEEQKEAQRAFFEKRDPRFWKARQ